MLFWETNNELKQKVAILEAELSLKKEGDFNSEVLHWIDSLVVVIDLKGYMVTFNRASEILSGYRFDEVQDQPFWDILISDEERECVKSAITNVIDKELPNQFQNFWITKDGSKRLISWVNSILRKPDGSIEYILCTGRDITEQKKSEDALKQSESKYRELVQHANSIIMRFDTRGRITFFNEFAQSFFGFREGEILDQNLIGTILPQAESSGRDLKAMVEDIIRNPSRYVHNENENIKRNGDRVWIAWTNKPILDQDGNISEILSIGMDITDRKRAEEALRESEERLRAVFVAAKDVSFIITDAQDPEPTVLEFSSGAEKIFGYHREDIIGRPVSALLLPDDVSKFPEAHRRMRQGKPGFSGEITLVRKSGDKFSAICSTYPLLDGEGEMYAALAVSVDIGKQKELEARLQQAQKMEAIGTLAGGIAHDFNNILSAVMGYTEMSLSLAAKESDIHLNLQEVMRAGMRAKDLVNHILAFSRQAEQERKPSQVKRICMEAVRFLRASLPTTIEIRQEIKSDALVMADPTQIHQVIMNLCTNAGHAMREKGGVLEVKLSDVLFKANVTPKYPELKPGPYLELTISDTGHGIPAHMLGRIFDPFFTTKEKGEGTGMGLAVVHGIVGSYGGTITLASKPGEGSIFKVYLPAEEREKTPVAATQDPIATGTERILFVDDETTLVKIGKQMLEALGYKVTGRSSSIEALELFKAKADCFDLVITDMTMPNMTGDELVRELRRIKPAIPTIMCSGYSARISQEQALAMGIRAFVSKPVLIKDIAQTIRQVLDER